jgi:hypothetical protein
VWPLAVVRKRRPSFAIGERIFVLLARRRDGQLGIVGLFQGKFTVKRDDASGFDVAVRRIPGSAETSDHMTLEQLRSEVQAVLGK